ISLGRRSSLDAIGKILDLRAKMVDLRKLSFADHAVAAQTQFRCSLEPQAGVEFEIARRSDNSVTVDGGRLEAGDELCKTAGREAQHSCDGRFHLAKPRVIVRSVRHRHRLDRLFSKDVTSRIDAIDPDVLERSTPTRSFQSVVPCCRLET